MNRAEAIRLIAESNIPDIVVDLHGDATSRQIAERHSTSPQYIIAISGLLKLNRDKGTPQSRSKKNTLSLVHKNSGVVKAFFALVNGGMSYAKALTAVSKNYDVPYDIVYNCIKNYIRKMNEDKHK